MCIKTDLRSIKIYLLLLLPNPDHQQHNCDCDCCLTPNNSYIIVITSYLFFNLIIFDPHEKHKICKEPPNDHSSQSSLVPISPVLIDLMLTCNTPICPYFHTQYECIWALKQKKKVLPCTVVRD